MLAQISMNSKTFNYNRITKAFPNKYKFQKYVHTNPALQKAVEENYQSEETDHTQENTMYN